MNSPFLKLLSQRVLIGDGAMGTRIQSLRLKAEDFGGAEGCNENLNLTRPELIKEIHAGYLEAGADMTETNSFGSSALVLGEYGLAAKAYELSGLAARLARGVADDFSSAAWPRFVAGSVGPTTKLPTLRHASFDEMHGAYLPQMLGLLEGGVDLLQIETCQDILQAKCAVLAARDAMQRCGRAVPLCVTITIESGGRMLIGTELAAALVVLESLEVDIIGINCATGPDMMRESVRFLSRHSSRPLAVFPNAGLPRSESGRVIYDLSPADFAAHMETFVKECGAVLVGGCCGTTAEHIRELSARVGGLSPRARKTALQAQAASTFSAVALDQEGSSPLIIDERCNANGSKRFRQLLLNSDWEGAVEMARELSAEGAHVLDVCAAYAGRDEKADMQELLSRFALQVPAPLMIDSTQVEVIEAGLKVLGGRCIINSVNLEDGEEKFDAVCRLAKRFGAALIALTIDEQGMAKTAEKKLEVAKRIGELCLKRHSIPLDWLIFDPLTFTVASGDEESRQAAKHTLQALKLIKQALPGSRTILGVSNVSFGLKPEARQVLNSVFLAEALKSGLNAAIVHAKKIVPIHKIAPARLELALDLLYDRRRADYDPLFKLIEEMEAETGVSGESPELAGAPVEEVLKRRVIDGRKNGIQDLLDQALRNHSALEIINQILLEAMREVGKLFGSGEMQLPFVLQSAETMKQAVSYLQKFMDKDSSADKGCMVLATVRGDVHDIGKNLVDIILSNNGYRVINLGIKQPLEAIVAACREHKPEALGLSGLLVKSCQVMKENLSEMANMGFTLPVICGGAALNRVFVERELKPAYPSGEVFYGADAFSGLSLMDSLSGRGKRRPAAAAEPAKEALSPAVVSLESEVRLARQSSEVVRSGMSVLPEVPSLPFAGPRYVCGGEISLADVFPYINKRSLFALQWMYRVGKRSLAEYKEFIRKEVEPLFHMWCQKAAGRGWLVPAVAYGYFPCNSQGNSLIIYDAEEAKREVCRIVFPRQVSGRRLCIADYFLPRSSGRLDVVAFQVVTAGARAAEVCQELFHAGSYRDYLHLHGLAVEFTEALAEYWHRRVRQELGISSQDGATIDALLRQNYQGERFSFGYPACPSLDDQRLIFDLLEPQKIGVLLSSEFQLVPEESTSAIIAHHPEAGYFSIG